MSRSDRFLAQAGRPSYLGPEFLNLYVPRDESGQITAAWPWGVFFRASDPSPLMKARHGDYFVYLNTNLSPWQMTDQLKGLLTKGDPRVLKDLLIPPFKVVGEWMQGMPLGRAVGREAQSYAPLGSLWIPRVMGVPLPKGAPTKKALLKYEEALDKAKVDQSRRGWGKMGWSVQLIPRDKLFDNLSLKDYKQYKALLEEELEKPVLDLPMGARAEREVLKPVYKEMWQHNKRVLQE